MISIYRFSSVLRGWKVKDVSDAVTFLDEDPQPVTEDEVALKLMAEYKEARKNHEELVKERLDNLFGAMWWLGGATVLAFSAILVAFVSAAIHQKGNVHGETKPLTFESRVTQSATPRSTQQVDSGNENSSRTYNDYMAKPSTQKPPPTVLPKPGSGTVMIKGGGGDGSRR